jgi:hypothetical protein
MSHPARGPGVPGIDGKANAALADPTARDIEWLHGGEGA